MRGPSGATTPKRPAISVTFSSSGRPGRDLQLRFRRRSRCRAVFHGFSRPAVNRPLIGCVTRCTSAPLPPGSPPIDGDGAYRVETRRVDGSRTWWCRERRSVTFSCPRACGLRAGLSTQLRPASAVEPEMANVFEEIDRFRMKNMQTYAKWIAARGPCASAATGRLGRDGRPAQRSWAWEASNLRPEDHESLPWRFADVQQRVESAADLRFLSLIACRCRALFAASRGLAAGCTRVRVASADRALMWNGLSSVVFALVGFDFEAREGRPPVQ